MHIINPCSQLSKVDHSGNTSKNKQKIQNKIRGSDRMSQEQIQYKKKENRKKTQKIKNRQIYKHTFFFLLFLIIIQKLSKNGIMYSIFFIIFYFGLSENDAERWHDDLLFYITLILFCFVYTGINNNHHQSNHYIVCKVYKYFPYFSCFLVRIMQCNLSPFVVNNWLV